MNLEKMQKVEHLAILFLVAFVVAVAQLLKCICIHMYELNGHHRMDYIICSRKMKVYFVLADFFVKLQDEKGRALGFEPVTKFLPLVSLKSGNNLVPHLSTPYTRLMLLTAYKF